MKHQTSSVQRDLDKGLKSLAKSAAIVFTAILLSKILTYGYRIFIARRFGPEVYGIFSLAVMISGWFIIFSKLGLNLGLVRFIPFYRAKNEANKIRFIFKRTATLQFFMSLLFGAILFFSSDFISAGIFHNQNLAIFLKFFSLLLPVNVFFITLLSVLKAYELIGWHSLIFNVFLNLLKLAFLVILVLFGLEADAIIFSYALGFLAATLIAYMACKYAVKNIFGKYHLGRKLRKKIFQRIFSYSWPLLFFGMISSVFQWTDSLIIGIFNSPREVGFYSAAINIAILLSLTPEIFMQLFFPLISRKFAKGKIKVISELSKQVGKWIFLINLPLLILIFLFPKTVINLLFGSQYFIASTALRFLVVGIFFSSIFRVSNELITMSGKSKTVLFDILIASAINLALNMIFVPLYGINGAAAATMVSLILLNILFCIQAKFYLSVVPLRRKMLRISLISVIPLILVLFIRKYLAPINLFKAGVLGAFFMLSYFILIFITSSLDKNDFMILKSIKNRIAGKRK